MLEDPALLRLLLMSTLLLVVGGAAFLAFWEIPPPTREVEAVLPDERLPR